MGKLKLEGGLTPSLFIGVIYVELNSELRQFFTNGFLDVLNGNLIVVVNTYRGQNIPCITGVQWKKRTQSRHLRFFCFALDVGQR